MSMSDDVAPDGSPVDIYLALPAGRVPDIIDSQLGPASTVLELGSGPGRITHPLRDLGHQVVAVDDSPEMLAHIRGAETVLADLFSLELGRTFDAVVAGSHLINTPAEAKRRQLLEVCRRHVRPDGVVLVERYEPEWATDPQVGDADVGGVHIRFEPLDVDDDEFTGQVVYTFEGRAWTQRFTASPVTDDVLAAQADMVGLRLADWIDEKHTWARLEPRTDRRST
jgi:SAM-dependent methyltransferase